MKTTAMTARAAMSQMDGIGMMVLFGIVYSALEGFEERYDSRAPHVYVAHGKTKGRTDEGKFRGVPGELLYLSHGLRHDVHAPLYERLRPSPEASAVPLRLPDGNSVPEEGDGKAAALHGIGHHKGAPPGLRIGVHRYGNEVQEPVGGEEAHRLVRGEAPGKVVEDIVEAATEDVVQISEHLLGTVDAALSRRQADDIIWLYREGVMREPQGEGRLGIL